MERGLWTMTTRRIYTKDKVLQMFKENDELLATDIADKLGVSRQYVARILRQAGQNTRKRQKELTEERYKELERKYIQLYSVDITIREMSEELGVSPSVVEKVSKRTGLRFGTLADIRKMHLYRDIVKGRNKGMTLQEIADEKEVTIGYVSRIYRWGKDREEEDVQRKAQGYEQSVGTTGTDEMSREVTEEEKEKTRSELNGSETEEVK